MLRSTLKLASGAGIARAIGVASIPILARLYTPADFGVMALFSSVILTLTPLATFRYHVAIPLPRMDRTAFAVMVLCSGIAIAISVAIGLLLAIGGESVIRFLALDPLLPFVYLIPFGLALASLVEILIMWGTRRGAYGMIAGTQVFQSILGEGSKAALGFAKFGAPGLIAGHMLGHISAVSGLLFHFRSQFRVMAFRVQFRHLTLVARRFRGFPISRMPSQILLVLSAQAPLFLMARYFDVQTTGQMSIAILGFMIPFLLVGQAASRAYFGEIAKIGSARPRQIILTMGKIMLSLGLLSLPIAILLFFLAVEIATVALGAEWAQAGRFISLLAIALVPQLISATVINTLDVLETHSLVLILNATRLALVSLAFIVPANLGASPEEAVLSYSVALSAHYLIQIAVIYAALRSAITADGVPAGGR